MVLSDRIAVMKEGIVQQFAAPMTVYNEPANRFVASFIGSPQMNFVPGSMAGSAHGDTTLVGIRPHDLGPRVGGSPENHDDIRLEGELTLVESAGPIHFLDVMVGDRLVKATCTDLAGLSPGERLTLHAPARAIRLFDAASGARL